MEKGAKGCAALTPGLLTLNCPISQRVIIDLVLSVRMLACLTVWAHLDSSRRHVRAAPTGYGQIC